MEDALSPADFYEPSPLEMSGLERTSIHVPPWILEETFGYRGSRRYVFFHFSPRFNGLMWCDGPERLEHAAHGEVWRRLIEHPLVTVHLRHFNQERRAYEAFDFGASFGPLAAVPLLASEDEAKSLDADVVTTCLLLDREDGTLFAGAWTKALQFHVLMADAAFESGPVPPGDDPPPGTDLMEWLDEQREDAGQLFNAAASSYNYGDYQASLRTLQECLRLEPGTDKFHYRLSQVYAALDRWEEALASCETAVRLQASAQDRGISPEVMFKWLGRCRFELGQFEEAAEAYTMVLQLDEDLHGTSVYGVLGKCYTKLGRHKEAIEAYEAALEMAMGEVFSRRLSETEGASEEDEEMARDLDKYAVGEAFEALGKAQLFAGRLREGEESLQQAMKTSPNTVRAYAYLGIAHALLGKRAVAAEEFNLAAARARLSIAHDPQSGAGYAALAFASRLMGDEEAATAAWARATALGWRSDPDNDLLALLHPHTHGSPGIGGRG